MKEQYDKKMRPLQIAVGDRVLIRNYDGKVGSSRKFQLPWNSIFRVVELEGIHVTVQSCSSPQAKQRTHHINQVKKCFELLGPACTVPELPEEERDAIKAAESETFEPTRKSDDLLIQNED